MPMKIKTIIKNHKKLYNTLYPVYCFFVSLFYRLCLMATGIDDKAVLFISFMGEQYSDNPRAFYEEMIRDPRYRDFKYYWVFKDKSKFESIPSLKKAQIVSYGSVAYYLACAKAKYWISNARMKNELRIRKGQVYVQTWHGTPLKKLGFDIGVIDFKDIGGGLSELKANYLKDAKRYSYIISPSAFYTEKITSAFGLRRIAKENIFLEYGYPRNDFLFTHSQADVDEIKRELKIAPDKKIILYAPTFRENSLKNNSYHQSLMLDFERLKRELSSEYVILFRLHYYVSSILDLSGYDDFLIDVSSYYDISSLYVISDILITDYSSVFFDYSNLQRPIIFYMYDLDEYSSHMHDFYIDFKELPGPIVYTEDELIEKIHDKSIEDYDYSAFNDKYNPHQVSCSSKLLDKIISIE